MVELGVSVGNFGIQAVGEVVQDADAVLHRLKSPPEEKSKQHIRQKNMEQHLL